MMDIEASFSGTLRTILILLIIWWVLRLLLRMGQRRSDAGGVRWTRDTGKARGEVTIERLKNEKRNGDKPGGNVTDADFEEVK